MISPVVPRVVHGQRVLSRTCPQGNGRARKSQSGRDEEAGYRSGKRYYGRCGCCHLVSRESEARLVSCLINRVHGAEHLPSFTSLDCTGSRPTRCSRPSTRELDLKDRCTSVSSRSAGNSDSAGSGRVSDPGSVRCTSICSSARGMLIGFDTLHACVHVVMTAGLVTGQFLIYGWIKEALNAPPGVEIHKEEK